MNPAAHGSHDPDDQRPAGFATRPPGFATLAVHAGQPADPTTGSVMTPVYLTSTYKQRAPGDHDGYEYSRTGNPTRNALEANLAALEGGRHGLCYASGLAATDTVAKLLSSGDHVVAGDDLYGGTYRLFENVYRRFGVSFDFVDTTNLDSVKNALRPETRLVWVETPSNPLLKITDLAGLGEMVGASDALLVVDNTFATPYLQQPLAFGADLVMHSTTKYLGGHSDVVGGALIMNDDALHERLAYLQNAAGAVPGPLDSFLVMRGTKTLPVRMDRHMENAARVVEFLVRHPQVARVGYPGLPEHPGHAIAARQMRGFGGMVWFVLEGESEEDARRMVSRTHVFALAESLGGVESLIEHPTSMTHGAIPREERLRAGLSDGLIRLSVGIEDVADLIADLDQALAGG